MDSIPRLSSNDHCTPRQVYYGPYQPPRSAGCSGLSEPSAVSTRAGEPFTTDSKPERIPEEFSLVRSSRSVLSPWADRSGDPPLPNISILPAQRNSPQRRPRSARDCRDGASPELGDSLGIGGRIPADHGHHVPS